MKNQHSPLNTREENLPIEGIFITPILQETKQTNKNHKTITKETNPIAFYFQLPISMKTWMGILSESGQNDLDIMEK